MFRLRYTILRPSENKIHNCIYYTVNYWRLFHLITQTFCAGYQIMKFLVMQFYLSSPLTPYSQMLSNTLHCAVILWERGTKFYIQKKKKKKKILARF
jgi:hypothetical protein